MDAIKTVYSDTQGISVTLNTLKVKEISYPLKEIIGYRPIAVNAKGFYGFLFLIISILVTAGYAKLVGIKISIGMVNIPVLSLCFGLCMALLALCVVMFRKRYALQIITRKGVKNILVSHKKEYISKIIHSLNVAISDAYYARNPAVQKINCGLSGLSNCLSLN